MEFARVVMEYIAWILLGRYLLGRLRRGCICQCAFPGGIVDLHTGLDVESIDAKANPCTAVLDRIALHENTARQQVFPLKNGRRAIEHMIAGLLHIIGYLILKRQHPLDIQIPRAGDQIALICIFGSQLIAN